MRLFSLLFLTFLTTNFISQNNITGSIANSKKEPLPFCTIEVFNKKDSSLITILSSDTSGNFNLSVPKIEQFYFKVSFIGYKDFYYDLKLDSTKNLYNIGVLILEDDSKNLNEVVVNGEKKLIEKKIDRIIFNVDNNIANSAGNALEVLSRTPLIRVNNDDITIIGKSSVKILINGRLSVLSGQDLMNFIRSIPAQDILRIEVITNPPANFDAQGNSGLVNIVLKKYKLIGTNGTMSVAYTQAFYGTGEIAGSINNRKKKTNIYANVNYRDGATHPIEKMDVSYSEKEINQVDNRIKSQKNLTGVVGLDYSPNDKNIFGMQYSGFMTGMNIDDQISSKNSYKNFIYDSTIYTSSKTGLNLNSNSLNLNYVRNIDSLGKRFNIDVDMLSYSNHIDRNYKSSIYSENSSAFISEWNKKNNSKQIVNFGTLKLDFDLPNKYLNLYFGGKLTLIENNSDNYFYLKTPGGYEIDTLQSNVFKYKENTQALYLNADRSFKNFEVQIGLRGENTNTDGYSPTMKSRVLRQYFQIFPTAFLLYKFNDRNNISASYGKRINRPGYSELNPFRFYLTPYSYAEGNPFLKPSFNHNAELTYTLKDQYIFSLYYQSANGYFAQAPVIENNNNILFLQQNIGSLTSFGAYTILPFKVKDFWRGTFTLYYYEYIVNSQTTVFQNSRSQVISGDFNSQFFFGKNSRFTAELSCNAMPPGMREGIYTLGQMYVINLGFKMAMFDKTAFLSLGVNDLLHNSSPSIYTTSNGIPIQNNNTYDTRNFRISFIYKFGNKTLRGKRQRDLGNIDEKRRAK